VSFNYVPSTSLILYTSLYAVQATQLRSFVTKPKKSMYQGNKM